MNKYFVRFSIMAFSGGFYVKAVDRKEALIKAKKRFNKEYKFELRYPNFSLKKEKWIRIIVCFLVFVLL